jgi:hypothetical protein
MPNLNGGNQVTLTIVWFDSDLIEIEACVSVGRWAGVACAYTTADEIQDAAHRLIGFSKSLSDEVLIELGLGSNSGMVSLRIHPIDRAKHLICLIRLVTKDFQKESCRLVVEMKTEAAAVIRFAEQLAQFSPENRTAVVLNGEPI